MRHFIKRFSFACIFILLFDHPSDKKEDGFMFGLGKPRTKLGRYIDRHGISQGQLEEWTGLGRSTIMRICNDTSHGPHEVTMMKIVSALRKRGYSVSVDDLM